MLQNEQEYIGRLKDRLTGHVSSEDLDEILADYAEHFSIGKSEGRSEEELCKALGAPDDVAREILASYMVKKAEQARSAGNIWHAVMATLGLGIFNLVFVLIPVVLLIALLAVIVVAGCILIILGPILLLVVILQMFGVTVSTPWSLPGVGILISIGICIAGVFLVIAGFSLARFFYRHLIRYLKWNIRAIRGGQPPDRGEPCPASFTIPRDGAENLDLQVRIGAGELNIGEGSGGLNLVDLRTLNGTSCSRPSCTSSANGRGRLVRIRGRHAFATSWWSDESSPALDIGVSREVPAALSVRNSAGRIVLALGTLNLTSLRIGNGAGETKIDLAGYRGGSFDAVVKNGVGHLVIRVPKECSVRVQVRRGIGDADVRGFLVDGDTYLTRPDRPDAPRITIYVKQGVGALSLEAV
jgi:uncharacterized membrane protein